MVLGDRTEDAFRQSMLLSGGKLSVFVASPLAAIITTLALLCLLVRSSVPAPITVAIRLIRPSHRERHSDARKILLPPLRRVSRWRWAARRHRAELTARVLADPSILGSVAVTVFGDRRVLDSGARAAASRRR